MILGLSAIIGLKGGSFCAWNMSDWIKVVTEGGITRIKMKAICAYQITEDETQLLIYTKDNSLFQVTKDAGLNFELLDSHFKIK
jgi:hypothetical protein